MGKARLRVAAVSVAVVAGGLLTAAVAGTSAAWPYSAARPAGYSQGKGTIVPARSVAVKGADLQATAGREAS